MNRPIKLSLAVALALAAGPAFGLGLGSIDVKSKMNEPLFAEIPIVSASPDEVQSLKVDLASAEDFARVGLDVSGLTVPLDFAIGSDPAGQPIIVVTSEEPVREPFVSFLVEVDWANGRLLREFSVLLDPPVAPAVVGSRTIIEPIAEQAPAPTVSVPEPFTPAEPIAPPPEPVSEAPAPEVEPASAEPEPVVAAEPEPVAAADPEPVPQEVPVEPEPVAETAAPEPEYAYTPAPEPTPGEYGPVATGETLWEIAENTRAPGVDMNRMMLAILRANPDAFYRDNVNALKRGAILRIPSADEARALASTEAMSEIVAQHQAWRADTVVADTGYTPPSSTTPAPASTPTDSRLALVPPSSGASGTSDRPGAAGGTDDSAQVRGELARTREQLASSNQETAELRQRVQELEKIQGDTTRLLELRNTEMAELQRRLAAADAETQRLREQAAAAEAAAVAAAAQPQVEPGPAPTVDESAAAPPAEAAPAPSLDPSADTSDTAVAAEDSASTDAIGSDPTVVDPLATDAVPADGDTDAVVDSDTLEPPAATDAGSDASLDQGGAEVTPLADPEPVETAAVVEPASPGLMGYLRNPWVLGGAAALAVLALLGLLMRTRRSEAEASERRSVADSFGDRVYAGGSAAAAASAQSVAHDEEHALLERLAEDPTAVDTHLDLLRLYYARGDADKYEAAAGALYAQVPGPDSPAWREAADMGRELCPGNPLFDAPRAVEREEFDFDHLTTEEVAAPVVAATPTPRADEDDFASTAYTPTASRTPPAAAPSDGFDFNLLDEPRAPAPEDARTQQISRADLDAHADAAPRTDVLSSDDAVGTKLDLARAYLDMGDPEGARSMLEEVLAEGNDGQKDEARRLLADIG